jgi:hypothetical protein
MSLQKKEKEIANKCIKLLNDTDEMSVSTLTQIHHQGEQLDRINNETNIIKQKITVSRRLVHSISTMFGGIINSFVPSKMIKKTESKSFVLTTGESYEENEYDSMSNCVKRLKQMSIDMNQQLKNQNSILNTTTTNINKNTDNLSGLIYKIDKL